MKELAILQSPKTSHYKSGERRGPALLSVATPSQYKQAAATVPLTCLTDWAKVLFKTVKATFPFLTSASH